jgi:mRNA interferase MazF
MRRGEIWLVDLEPVRGSEANKTRPVIIVSNDGANIRASSLGRGVITVVPITSNTSKIYSFQMLIPQSSETNIAVPSKAQAEQLRSVDYQRFIRRIGRLSSTQIDELDERLKLHLAL